ncbi:MFS transporter [Phreatobacter sp. AB_2022a]|uniref:MFS transporter n=1 Tax=Phreatobacter sp. AB_2022a TaxID=3003134 RepID=UPI00056ED954|nr:MFS transporter [Phreatobacter sp. AB_2022a]MCZ0734268.1 MFS transporter [Phreatobacter sp. AB_2022a]CEJ11810.1 Proline/betaine transporter [bacterium YEK0313]
MSQAATADLPDATTSAEYARIRRRAILSCAVGNFVELFDFLIFGLFAAQIAANFFPSGDPVVGLLSAFATYGVGFVMRPVGAIVIGAYGDRKGRKAALVLTVGLMAGATALTGLIPSYATIGIWAPLLLVLCRLVQGFSTGGEWGGAAAFLVEYAPPGRRGLIGSMQQFSVGLALIAGTLIAAVLNSTLSKEQMIDWGWRIPFIMGFVLAPIGLYLRSRVSETPAFHKTVDRQQVASSPVRDALTIYKWPVLAAFGLSVVGTVGNYTFNIFMPSFASGQLGISAGTAYYSSAAAAVVLTLLTPFAGWLSDVVGRKPVLLVSAIGYGLFSYPLFQYLVAAPSGMSLAVTQCISAALLGFYAGPLCAVLAELFPTKVRFTALSIGYSMAVTIFGGFAPFVATFLIRETGSPVSPALFVILAAVISSITLILIKDPTNAPLD